LHAADDIFCDQQSSALGFEEEPHSGASDREGEYAKCNRIQKSEY
jgi:hypothetical protein